MRRAFLLWLAIGLLAASGAAAGTDVGIAGFQLPDQSGRLVEVAPSGRNTLISFYRGDW
jgi:hypothetical protein